MAGQQTRLEDIVEKLRDRGCRITPQRMAVLDIVCTSTEHPSAEQIYTRVKEDFPMTSLATVYKTLALLEDMGEALKLAVADNGAHFDVRESVPHPHLICKGCHRIIDLDPDLIDDLPQEVARRTRYEGLECRLDFFGTCPECQRRGSAKSGRDSVGHADYAHQT